MPQPSLETAVRARCAQAAAQCEADLTLLACRAQHYRWELDLTNREGAAIATSENGYGCTPGSSSRCGGATT